MTDFTKDLLKYSITLLVIAGVAALVLSPVFKLTKPNIEKIDIEKNEQALKELFPKGKVSEIRKIGEDNVTVIKDDYNNILGITFMIIAKGYGGPISILAGMDFYGQLKGIKVISHTETPGLGAKLTEIKKDEYIWDKILGKIPETNVKLFPWFQEQFGQTYVSTLRLVKTAEFRQEDVHALTTATGKRYKRGIIQSITGATITSRAVINSVKGVGMRIMDKFNQQKLKNVGIREHEMIMIWPTQSIRRMEASEY